MILFVFEGKREEIVFKSMEAIFFSSLPAGESILSAFAMFLYDYFGRRIVSE